MKPNTSRSPGSIDLSLIRRPGPRPGGAPFPEELAHGNRARRKASLLAEPRLKKNLAQIFVPLVEAAPVRGSMGMAAEQQVETGAVDTGGERTLAFVETGAVFRAPVDEGEAGPMEAVESALFLREVDGAEEMPGGAGRLRRSFPTNPLRARTADPTRE